MAAYWNELGFWGPFAGAILIALVAASLIRRLEKARPAKPFLGDLALLGALIATSIWSLGVALSGSTGVAAALTETARNASWLLFMFLMVRSARSQPVSLVAIYAVLGLILVIQPVIDIWRLGLAEGMVLREIALTSTLLLRMLFAVGALVVAHNLYVVASAQTRATIRLPLTALAAMWLYDLNLYMLAYLAREMPVDLLPLRGVVTLLLVPFFAMAATRSGGWKLQLSRKVAIRSISLVAISGYLLLMIAIAQLLRMAGSDIASMAQTGLVIGMSIAALVLIPSERFRAWFKVKVAKHFFRHRYDYRLEWMRFTDTIGRPGDGAAPFHERVIKAIADIADSPAGLLLTPNDNARLELQARFNWPTALVPARACTATTISWFQGGGRIIELDALRNGRDPGTDRSAIPDWIVEETAAWVLVPLVHFDRLAGLVVLARPPISRTLDWEDFDLLRVAGRQVASYLAEARSQEALLETEQFDEFNRRFAFVMHDIKNLVSQLSLVARNAEKHADNPAFRADMIDTLQNSVGKMKTLIARLTRYTRADGDVTGPVDVERLVATVIGDKGLAERVHIQTLQRVNAQANAAQLEQVIGHLLQNAIDASGPAGPVYVHIGRDAMNAQIEVVDQGCGMSAEFVRSKLFKPFISSKPDGFGIGAYEARSLVEAMHGRIDVESREGEGTRFLVELPLVRQLGEPDMPVHEDRYSQGDRVAEKVR
ncbi:MAG: PEP-CTERM system histidine kinase PrsK [Blastomonas sp.]